MVISLVVLFCAIAGCLNSGKDSGGTAPAATPSATPLNSYFTVNCHAREERDNGGYTEITVDGTIPIDDPAADRDWILEPKVSWGGTGARETRKMHYTYVDYHACDQPNCNCKYAYDAYGGQQATIGRLPRTPVTAWKAWFSAVTSDSGNTATEVKTVLPACIFPFPSKADADSASIMCFNGPGEEFSFSFRDGEVITVKGKNNGGVRDVTYGFHISAK
jgi:hypothetical protein